MARRKVETETRQLYASIREDVYLATKARAAEMRIPLREFLEIALERALAEEVQPPDTDAPASIWDDEYLGMQAGQPLGSPVEITRDEAERLVRESFGARGPERERAGPLTGNADG
jgi:hypothetical protein